MLFTTKQKYTSERLVRLPRSCRLSPQTSLRQPATSQRYPWLKATAELSCCSAALWPAQASLGHKVITEIGTQLIHQLSKSNPPIIRHSNLGTGIYSAPGLKLKPGSFLHNPRTRFITAVTTLWPSVQVPVSISVSLNLISKHPWQLAVVPAHPHDFRRKLTMWRVETTKSIETEETKPNKFPFAVSNELQGITTLPSYNQYFNLNMTPNVKFC